MKLLLASLVFFVVSGVQAQPKDFVGPRQPIELKRLLLPTDAYGLALADCLTLPAHLRPLVRYIWEQNPSVEKVKSLSADLNRISRYSVVFKPVVLAENRLIRVELTRLSADVEVDLKEIVDTWEKLRFEPKFNLLLTPDVQKVVKLLPENQWPKPLIRDGNKFKAVSLSEVDDTSVVRLPAGHLNPEIALQLQSELWTAAPVVTAEYFRFRALNTIKRAVGDNTKNAPFETIWGGLYYEFRGIKKSPTKDKTDLQFLLEQLGATGKRVAEQRVAMFRSGVTHKPRAIEFLPATNLRVGDGQGAVVITHDIKDESIDASQHAMMSLRKETFKPDGHEVIFIGENGFNGYALYNDKDELVDEVPHEIADDTTIPGSATKRLQAAISCIRCHEAEGSDGWKPVVNHVQEMVDQGLDVFGDVSDGKRTINRTIQELSAQYKGKPDRFLRNARFALQAATLEATGAWERTKPTDVVKVTARQLENAYASYWFSDLTAPQALSELGFEAIPKDQSLPFLKRLLPPDEEGRAFGIVPEDVRIFALTHKQPVSRNDFSLVYAFAQYRASRELAKMKGAKP